MLSADFHTCVCLKTGEWQSSTFYQKHDTDVFSIYWSTRFITYNLFLSSSKAANHLHTSLDHRFFHSHTNNFSYFDIDLLHITKYTSSKLRHIIVHINDKSKKKYSLAEVYENFAELFGDEDRKIISSLSAVDIPI